MYKLRPYQQESVDATIKHFKMKNEPAVIVLPTGAGKSLVVAELARIALGKVLVLAHVKELVEQNHQKFEAYGVKAGIFSASLKRKESGDKVIFGSIQSVSRAPEQFFSDFSLLVIDECHRVSLERDSQYQAVIKKLRNSNSKICILGLTATPYRLGLGWIYKNHSYGGHYRTDDERFFIDCIYELPLSFMIKNEFLTPPILIDSPVACYDFSSLCKSKPGDSESNQRFAGAEIEKILKDQKRVTPGIVKNIIDQAIDRKGVMIFTSSVAHAREVLTLLPDGESFLITGETDLALRAQIINDFKAQKSKYLVNVSVLTTGFDAPHVDLIAVLRPTESVSLYQQIVGRGLRLFRGKEDCLILDYTGMAYDLFSPEIGESRPAQDTEVVEVQCPQCEHPNQFWGRLDEFGDIYEHFGRKCQGRQSEQNCDFRFRYKTCHQCAEENDIASRVCRSCKTELIDPDKKLKEAMTLKNAHVLKTDSMFMEHALDKKNRERLEIKYYDADGQFLQENFYLDSKSQKKAFYLNFIRPHLRNPGPYFEVSSIEQILFCQKLFRMPSFVIARKQERFWKIREKIFN
jgi:DNA repair protein RadD